MVESIGRRPLVEIGQRSYDLREVAACTALALACLYLTSRATRRVSLLAASLLPSAGLLCLMGEMQPTTPASVPEPTPDPKPPQLVDRFRAKELCGEELDLFLESGCLGVEREELFDLLPEEQLIGYWYRLGCRSALSHLPKSQILHLYTKVNDSALLAELLKPGRGDLPLAPLWGGPDKEESLKKVVALMKQFGEQKEYYLVFFRHLPELLDRPEYASWHASYGWNACEELHAKRKVILHSMGLIR